MGDDVDCLVPGNALPLVLAPGSHAEHGILVAVGVVERLDAGKPLGAHPPLAHAVRRIALHLHHTPGAHRGDDAAVGDAGPAAGLDLLFAGLRRCFCLSAAQQRSRAVEGAQPGNISLQQKNSPFPSYRLRCHPVTEGGAV